MKSPFLSLFVLLCALSTANAQNKIEPYQSKWHYNPSFGVNIPITKFFKGDIPSDYLFEYDDNYYYWQVISFSYFFHKHWGVEFSCQSGNSNRLSSRADKFLNWMQAEYDDNYYVSPSTGASIDTKGKFWGGEIQRQSFGVIYRMEFDRFLVYPKFSIGVVSFTRDWGRAKLKEKNTNNVVDISYGSHKPMNNFMISPSVMLGYKLSKRVWVNVDIIAMYFNSNSSLDVIMEDRNTGTQNTNTINNNRNVFNLNVGAGLIIVLK